MRKRILALLCTAAILLSLTGGAFAATPTPYTLKMAGLTERAVLADSALDCAVTVNPDGTSGTLTFVRYVPACSTLIIPETIQVKDGSKITTVTITALGSRIFRLGQYSFPSISIPEGVTFIDPLFMSGFSGGQVPVTAVEVVEANTVYKSVDGVVFSKDGTKLVHYPSGKAGATYVVPNGVTIIGESAFTGAKNPTTITLPNGLVEIEARGMAGAPITSLNLPDDVTILGDGAFSGCSKLTDIDLPTSVTSIGKDLFSGSGIQQATLGMATIPEGFLRNCSSLTALTLEPGVTEIGEAAFYGCNYLTTVVFPASLKTVGKQAFAFDYRLASVTFNNGLTTIGEQAFWESGFSGELNLPASVTTLGKQAFEGTKITAIDSLGSVTHLPDNVFCECDLLTEVTIPAAIKTMGSRVFYDCENLRLVTVAPGGITAIPDGAFQLGGALTEVNLPDTVTTIGDSAFAGNYMLESITLPTGLKSLGNRAFNGCRALKAVDIPDGVTALGTSMFEDCWSLQSIKFPAALKEIGIDAFNRCYVLQRLEFPETLEKLGVYHSSLGGSDIYNDAFGYTPELISVTFLGDKPNSGGNRPFALSPSEGHHKDLTVYHPSDNNTYSEWTAWSYPAVKTGKPTDPPAINTAIALHAVLEHSRQGELLLWCTVDITPKTYSNDNSLSPAGAVSFTVGGEALPKPIYFVGGNTSLHQTVGYRLSEDLIGKEITVQAHLSASAGFNPSQSNILTGMVVKPEWDKQLPFVEGGPGTVEGQYATQPDADGKGVILTKMLDSALNGATPVIPDKIGELPVTGLGDGLFADNPFTAYVDIPSSVKTLGKGVFKNCLNLVSVHLPAGLTEIPEDTFSGCADKLSTVVLPDTVRTVGANAFQGCTEMDEMIFPASLETLDASAFSGCVLTRVTFEGNAPVLIGYTSGEIFDHWTILTRKVDATGFDVSPWAEMRREPVTLGLDFTAEYSHESKTLIVTPSFTTPVGYPKPDLNKVVVRIYNSPITDGVKVENDKIIVSVPEMYDGQDAFIDIWYPGDWYYKEARSVSKSEILPFVRGELIIESVRLLALTSSDKTLSLAVTPTFDDKISGSHAYKPDLTKMEVTLDGKPVVNFSVNESEERSLTLNVPVPTASSVPLTLYYPGDYHFKPSNIYEVDVEIPSAPVEPPAATTLNATAGTLTKNEVGEGYHLPLTVTLANEPYAGTEDVPDRGEIEITINNEVATYTTGEGSVLKLDIPAEHLYSTVNIVITYPGEARFKASSTTLNAVKIPDPDPQPMDTTISAIYSFAWNIAPGWGHCLALDITLNHDPYHGDEARLADSKLITVKLGDADVSAENMHWSDNKLLIPVEEALYSETISITISYPGESPYFNPSDKTLENVLIADPDTTRVGTWVTATEGEFTKDEVGGGYYLPIIVALSNHESDKTPSRADIVVTLNGSEVVCADDGEVLNLPIPAERIPSVNNIISIQYKGDEYFLPSSTSLNGINIPDPNAKPVPEAISVTPKTLKLTSAGAQGMLSVSFTPEGTTAEVVWSSDKTSVATVDQSGKVTAVANGTAIITAKAGSLKNTCAVTVDIPAPPSGNGGGGGGGSSSTPKPSTDENAKVTVSNKDVTEAVKAAADSGSVVLKAETSENAKSVAVTVPSSVMKAIAKAEAPVSIQSSVADLTLDTKVLEALQQSGVKDVVVSAGTADTAALPKAAQTALEGRPVYDISITSGGKNVSQFNGGNVTVALPYTPAAGESSDSLAVCWVKEDGSMEVLRSSVYKDGKLTFSTPHLSTYAIMHRAVSFLDVSSDLWFKSDIDFTVARGILNGMGDDGMGGELFGPAVTLTGTMAVVALARMDGVADGTGAGWAAPAMAWAEEKDILPEGFDADSPLTREQFAYLVAGYLGGAKASSAPAYLDRTQITSSCLESINYLASIGVMNGTGDGYFSPKLTLTRSELAAVLHRLVVLQLG